MTETAPRTWRRPVVTGRRVALTTPARTDEADLLAAVARSRDLHASWVVPPSTHEEFVAYLGRARRRDQLAFLVRERTVGGLAGVVNVNHVVRGALASGALGYYALEPWAGQGLVRDAVALVLDHAFGALALHRLEANIQPGNERSRALVASLGFRCEGFSPAYLYVAGAWRDHERWAILAEEWRPVG